MSGKTVVSGSFKPYEEFLRDLETDADVHEEIVRAERRVRDARAEMFRRGYEQTPIGNWRKVRP